MTFDATPPRAPIGALQLGTIGLVGALVAVGVPAVTAALATSTPVNGRSARVAIEASGPIRQVVVTGSLSRVRISGDPAATGVSGQALVQWKGKDSERPILRQKVADGVLTLSKDCSGDHCGPVDLTLTVPRDVSVRASASDCGIEVSRVTGTVELASSNGDIVADHLGSGNAILKTTNGTIDASFTGAPRRITAGTTNGDLTIATDGRTVYYDSVTTANGNQNLTNVQDRMAAAEIDASTVNGDVTIS